jgi:hypothetical protein
MTQGANPWIFRYTYLNQPAQMLTIMLTLFVPPA